MNRVMESIFQQVAGITDVLAKRAANPIPDLVPAHDPFMAYLHEEMRQCYASGLDHAAILMACSLIEYFIKHLTYHDCFLKANRVFSPEKWDEIDAKDWSEAISYAKALGIITKRGWKRLDSFRDSIRNYYMHGSTPDHIKKMEPQVYVANWQTGEASQQAVRLSEDISLQRIFRIIEDRRTCESAVRFADEVARGGAIFEEARIREYEEKNPPATPSKEQLDKVLEAMRTAGFMGKFAITQQLPEELTQRPLETARDAG